MITATSGLDFGAVEFSLLVGVERAVNCGWRAPLIKTIYVGSDCLLLRIEMIGKNEELGKRLIRPVNPRLNGL